MKPESDIRVVDYLYDDLSEEQREAFAAHLEADEAEADQARAFGSLLSIYREESEEITPSVAATEKLLAQAHRATQPWYARLFGEMPSLLLRPAVGVAAMAVLVIGIGVFAFLSGRGKPDGAGSAARPPAEAPRSASDKLAESSVAPRGRDTGLKNAASRPGFVDTETDHDDAVALGAGGKAGGERSPDVPNRDGDLAQAGPRAADRTVASEVQKKGKAARKPVFRGFGATSTLSSANKEGLRRRRGAGRTAREFQLATKSPAEAAKDQRRAPAAPKAVPQAAPPPRRAYNAQVDGVVRGGGGAPATGSRNRKRYTYKQSPVQSRTSAPALLNAAQTQLAKGRIAQACQLFASLVRQHRSYTRRADALLGWARCEMSRGAYARAEILLHRLMKEHPGWRKAGQAWLAEVKRQRRRAAQRSNQRARARRQRKAAPRRPTRARPRPASTSR